ncbi:hypothetical protein HMPREF1861_02168 [Corynebacterium kroppenstedtii]|nr:hypothetical protein HMPREF1861_02168 [Corynebacterium kroppenstedtii]
MFVELTGILLRIKTWGNQNFLTQLCHALGKIAIEAVLRNPEQKSLYIVGLVKRFNSSNGGGSRQ